MRYWGRCEDNRWIEVTRLGISILVFFALIIVAISGLRLYDFRRDRALRENILKVKVGMSEQEVIQILREPTDRMLSDIAVSYWTYDTDTLGRLIDDNPDRMGNLALEMGSDERVVKVFDLR